MIDLIIMIFLFVLGAICVFVLIGLLKLFSLAANKIFANYTDINISQLFIVPLVCLEFIFIYASKDYLISQYNEYSALSTLLYLPGLLISIRETFNSLNGFTILGFSGGVFLKNITIIMFLLSMVVNLIYLLVLFYRIIYKTNKINTYKDKFILVVASYFLLMFNLMVIYLYVLYFYKDSFIDFQLSTNILEAILDAFYFSFKNFIAIGGNEANTILAKILTITITCINVYFLLIYVPMILSKKDADCVSSETDSCILSSCNFNYLQSEKYKLKRTWDETKSSAILINVFPTESNALIQDLCTVDIMNTLILNEFGSFIEISLFNSMESLKKSDNLKYDFDVEKYKNELDEAKIIILNFNANEKIYKKEVINILETYSEKLNVFNRRKKIFVPIKKRI